MTITHAAIQKDGFIVKGRSHKDCRQKYSEQEGIVLDYPYEEGFITSDDRFVNRQEAAEIAKKAGQVSDRVQYLESWMLKFK